MPLPVHVNDRVVAIKGNNSEIDRFIEEYKPFIAACTERTAGHYVRYGVDDELSIALSAFLEAINHYDRGRGSFLSFAQGVIRRRLIDYFRKENKFTAAMSLSGRSTGTGTGAGTRSGAGNGSGGATGNGRAGGAGSDSDAGEDGWADPTDEVSRQKYFEDEVSEYRRLEIAQLKEELSGWGISFADLARVSPRHDRTRKACREIVRYLMFRQDLLFHIRDKRQLPVAELAEQLKVPRKIIERTRKYIIAMIIIRTGDYQYISDYIK